MGKSVFFLKRHKFFILLLCVIIGYFGFLFIDQEMMIKDLQEEEERLTEKVEKWDTKIKSVEEKIEKSDNLDFVEKEAREKLKMVKENEIIYIIQDNEALN